MSKKDIKDLERKIAGLQAELTEKKDNQWRDVEKKEWTIRNLVNMIENDVVGSKIIEKIKQTNEEVAERYNLDLLETNVNFGNGRFISTYGEKIFWTFSEAIKDLDKDSLFKAINADADITEKEKAEAKQCYDDIVRFHKEVSYEEEAPKNSTLRHKIK